MITRLRNFRTYFQTLRYNLYEYPHFNNDEMKCKCGCKQNKMVDSFMQRLEVLREVYGKPIKISSGYRCPNHPIEAKKSRPGAHSEGLAADISCHGEEAAIIIKLALNMGFTGIGVNQKGKARFIHIDTIENSDKFPRPWIWSY